MPYDGRSISWNVAYLNILVHYVINLVYYDKQKYFYVYLVYCQQANHIYSQNLHLTTFSYPQHYYFGKLGMCHWDKRTGYRWTPSTKRGINFFSFLKKSYFYFFKECMCLILMMNCFADCLTSKSYSALFPVGTIVRDSHHCKFWQTTSRIWTCFEPEFRFCWMTLCSSNNYYTNLFY